MAPTTSPASTNHPTIKPTAIRTVTTSPTFHPTTLITSINEQQETSVNDHGTDGNPPPPIQNPQEEEQEKNQTSNTIGLAVSFLSGVFFLAGGYIFQQRRRKRNKNRKQWDSTLQKHHYVYCSENYNDGGGGGSNGILLLGKRGEEIADDTMSTKMDATKLDTRTTSSTTSSTGMVLARHSSTYKFGKIAPLDELPMYDTNSLVLNEDEEKGAFSLVDKKDSISGSGIAATTSSTKSDWQTTTTTPRTTASTTTTTSANDWMKSQKENRVFPPHPTLMDENTTATASLHSSSPYSTSTQSSSTTTSTTTTNSSYYDNNNNDNNHGPQESNNNSTLQNSTHHDEQQSPPSSPGIPIIDTRESFEMERDNLVMVKKDLIRSMSMDHQTTDLMDGSNQRINYHGHGAGTMGTNSRMLMVPPRPIRQSVLEPTKFDAFSLVLQDDYTQIQQPSSPSPPLPSTTPPLLQGGPPPPPQNIAQLSSSISPPSRSFPPSIPRQELERRKIEFPSLEEEEDFPEPPDEFMLDKTWDPDDASVDSQTPSLDGQFNYEHVMTDAEKHEFS